MSSLVGQVASLPLHSRLVYQFPEKTWIENIAVRKNGALLLSILSPAASLYQLSDPNSATPSVSLVHTFPEVNGLLGIDETSPDVFVVVGASFTGGEAAAFSVDFNGDEPVVETIANIPTAVVPNGLTSLPHDPTTVLIGDSTRGLIWRLDTRTGLSEVALQTPEMAASTEVKAGINGLKIFEGSLYFANSALASLFRVKLTPGGSIPPDATVETIAVLDAVFLDDFAFAADGTIFVETNKDNRVIALKPNDEGGYLQGVVVAGSVSSLTVAGDTAAAFGRTESDKKVLYVVTSGVAQIPGNATLAEGGKVVAIETGGY